MGLFARRLLVLGYLLGILVGLAVFLVAFSTGNIEIEFVVLASTIVETIAAQLFTRKFAQTPRNEIATGALRGFGWPTIVFLLVAFAALFFAFL